ncbi:MAG: DUF1592 domain-containing protein [Limisphaerales bacterium]
MNRHLTTCLVVWSVVGSVHAADSFESVLPLLTKYCFECHGEEKQKADLRMDQLSPDLIKDRSAETWHDVLDQLNLGEMPPKKARQPTAKEREAIVGWVTKALKEAAEARRFANGRTTMRRLTRYEYRNTMRDLLGVDRDFANDLPPEPMSPDGLLNNAATLEMSPTQIEAYLAAARTAMSIAIASGEKPEIHRYRHTNTITANLPKKKFAGHEPVNPEFAVDVEKYPRRGPFRLKLTARAAIPEQAGFPRIRVSLGHVPGIIHVPHKLIGEVELTSNKPRTFEFTGWMEDYPQAGDVPFGNSGIKGMILFLDYLDADGKELRYPDRRYVRPPPKPKKGQKPKPLPTPPPFGSRLEIAVDSLEFETPYYPSWPPPSHHRLIGDGRIREQLREFITRAFRRPVRDEELQTYFANFQKLRESTGSLDEAWRETCAAVLVSPHFLYVVERRMKDSKSSEPLTDHELATRLSYFLWNTMPDQHLSNLAAKGRLRRSLKTEVTRLLENRRSHAFANNFAEQWFDLGALERIAVNPEFYPNFNNDLKADMRQETTGFFNELLRHDLSCLDALDGDWTMLNRALARHYGISPLPRSGQFVRTTLPADSRRGGVLGQGSFLLSQSSGEFPHPIKRAVWILDRLLDNPPPPPPPDVPDLDSESPDLVGLSVKEQLALHRDREACANCHRGIDPWGLPLEHFDAIGQWREFTPVRLDKKRKNSAKPVAVDSQAELPNGTALANASELKAFLRNQRSEWFARAMVKRMLAYALGRSLDFGDRETVEKLTSEFIASDSRLRKLILSLVQSEAFQSK